jgi:hypothetical protein
MARTIGEITSKVHYLVNIIGETIQALSRMALTPEEINELLGSVHEGNDNAEAVYQKIRDAVLAGAPVIVFRRPFEDQYKLKGHKDVFGYRFCASRGSAPNKGRVYLKESQQNNKLFLDVPIATPSHNYDDEMIRYRLTWIKENRGEATNDDHRHHT